jgi:hypothetical protein
MPDEYRIQQLLFALLVALAAGLLTLDIQASQVLAHPPSAAPAAAPAPAAPGVAGLDGVDTSRFLGP